MKNNIEYHDKYPNVDDTRYELLILTECIIVIETIVLILIVCII